MLLPREPLANIDSVMPTLPSDLWLFTIRAQEKFEYRSMNFETNPKYEFSNVQNVLSRKDVSDVSEIWILVIRICLGFRYLYLEFSLGSFFNRA